MNEAILSQLVNETEIEVFKTMRSDMSSAGALLNDEQFGQFLRAAETVTSILPQVQFRRMTAMNQIVSATGISNRVLENGYKSANTTQDELTAATIDFEKAQLTSTKLKALCSILDDDKEDNIEREQFEQTLLSMMGEAVGRDLEAVCVFGDTAYDSTGKKLFASFNGWLKQGALYQVHSDGTKGAGSADFDLDDTVTAMFDAMMGKLPAVYRGAGLFNQFKFYVPYEVYDAYQNLVASRTTTMGDANLVGRPDLRYKNIPVEYAPVLDAPDGRTVFDKVPTILCNPNFVYYGVYKDLSVEPERKPALEQTNYYYRIRCAATMQFPNAFVTGTISAAEAAAIQEDNKL